MVTGTTGLGDREREVLAEAAKVVPVVDAPNMSIGVNVLCDLLARAVRSLGPEYHVEIMDIHHRHKKDAPSGTALRLANVVAETRGQNLTVVTHGREENLRGPTGSWDPCLARWRRSWRSHRIFIGPESD